MQSLQQTQMPLFSQQQNTKLTSKQSDQTEFSMKTQLNSLPQTAKISTRSQDQETPRWENWEKMKPKRDRFELDGLRGRFDPSKPSNANMLSYAMPSCLSVCVSFSLSLFVCSAQTVSIQLLNGYIYKILKEMTSRGRKGHNNYNYNYKLGLTDTLSLCVGQRERDKDDW